MIEIRKINVRLKKENKEVISNLTLRIENGKIKTLDEIDSNTIDKLYEVINENTKYEIKIDDILFNNKSFKKLLNNKNMSKQLLEVAKDEFKLMSENKFSVLDIPKKKKESLLDYVTNQVKEDNRVNQTMNDLETSLHNKVYGTNKNMNLSIPNINIDQEESDFDINHFKISGELLGNAGFSLIQFIGLIIGLGIIILTATRRYNNKI